MSTSGMRGTSRAVLAAGIFLLAAQSAALAKDGRKISVADDPSLKEGSPRAVLVEVSDFQ